MKIVVALVAALAFLATGCVPSETPAQPSETVTVTPAPETVTPEPETVPEPEFTPDGDLTAQEYLDLLREVDPYFETAGDNDLLDNAKVVCDALDSGVSVAEVVDIMVGHGIPAFSAGVLIQGGVLYRCPENQHLVDEFTGESSGSAL